MLLIHPSIAMIVYGAITEQSIVQLFIAGVFPGLILSALFISYIAIRAIWNPSIAPVSEIFTWKERIKLTAIIAHIISVVIMVLGLIYAGIATPT